MHKYYLTLLLTIVHLPAIACDQKVNPTTDCWNPPSKYVDKGLRRFYDISSEADKALYINDLEKAKSLAIEYLDLSKRYSKNWNYGNATHDANIMLGVIALRKGAISESGKYLIAAGASSGSPQLNSFGPNLTLANVLLEKSEIKAVLTYLKSVQGFWEMNDGKLGKWISEIERGKTPKLGRYAH